jgi:gliding motility-associated-like protein
MHTFKFVLCAIALSFVISPSFGQLEDCNDGIDNNGDGFIDCYDRTCSGDSDCQNDYIREAPTCEVFPTAFPAFTFKQQWESAPLTNHTSANLAIGDLDGDEFPEVVTTHTNSNLISILDGKTGEIIRQQNVGGGRLRSAIVLANINADDCSEIFVNFSSGPLVWVVAYDCELNELWREETRYHLGSIGITDFDGDGLIEIYGRDVVLDAHTGTVMAAGTYSTDEDDVDYYDDHLLNGGVAVDILEDAACPTCAGQELIQGGKIYAVDIDRTGAVPSATLDLILEIPGYSTAVAPPDPVPGPSPDPVNRGAVSVADYDQDGFLDVLMPGLDANAADPDHTRVFLWDVQTDTYKTYLDPDNDWDEGAGRLNVADIDGDGLLNTTFVSGEFLYALDENWGMMWKQEIEEHSSGVTGTTVFDFNGDGSAEIVYRDEEFLYIIDGFEGEIKSQIVCKSRTDVEYPIVADIDNDGATEICVSCHIDDVAGDIDDSNELGDGQIRVYESDGEQWVPARKVWNQHAYFNVNVNDDLTIPRVMQQHHQVFSTGVCGVGDNRPLNSFLNQSPIITADGCPNYAAPDVNFVAGSLVINTPTCPDTDFTISFEVSNDGDIDIDFDIPITFYNGDPLSPAAAQLSATTEHLVIPKGTSISLHDIPVIGPGSAFELFVLVNHNGTASTGDLALNALAGGIAECDPFNNMGNGLVTPDLFSISAEKVSDNTLCVPDPSINNGAARAFVLVGGVENTADYTFNWYHSATPTGPVEFTGSDYANLADGSYSVTAIHTSLLCESDIAGIVIDHVDVATPIVNIETVQNFTNCMNPNGALKAIVNGEEDEILNEAIYDFAWYEDNIAANLISTKASATGLDPTLYGLRVTEKSTGCITVANITVVNTTISPVVDVVTTDTSICGATGNGSASATVNGVTAGYTFQWYDGGTLNFTGSTYSGLTTGDYTVTATNNTTGCVSAITPLTILSLDQLVNPDFEGEMDLCSGDQMTFTDTFTDVFDNITDYRWDFGDGQSEDGQYPIPLTTHAFTSGGTFSVSLTVTNSITGCENTVSKTITVLSPPLVDFTSEEICAENTIIFNNQTTSGDGEITGYQWTLPDGTEVTTEDATYYFAEAGDFPVSLTTTSSVGCSETLTKQVHVKGVPEAGIVSMPDLVIEAFEPVQFFDESLGEGLSYYWDFGDENTSTEEDPVHTYQEVEQFTLTHAVSNAVGCTDTIRMVLDRNVYINLPNAFTPNIDGANDKLRLLYKGMETLLEFKVYNRHGRIVFDGKGDLDATWDGMYNEQPQPMGVYIAHVKALGTDGRNYNFKTNITLLK